MLHRPPFAPLVPLLHRPMVVVLNGPLVAFQRRLLQVRLAYLKGVLQRPLVVPPHRRHLVPYRGHRLVRPPPLFPVPLLRLRSPMRRPFPSLIRVVPLQFVARPQPVARPKPNVDGKPQPFRLVLLPRYVPRGLNVGRKQNVVPPYPPLPNEPRRLQHLLPLLLFVPRLLPLGTLQIVQLLRERNEQGQQLLRLQKKQLTTVSPESPTPKQSPTETPTSLPP